MVQFNLLPWKEHERQVQKIIFAATLFVVALMALFVVLLFHFYLDSEMRSQNQRNTFLQAQLTETQTVLLDLEKQQEQEKALLDEMQFIMNLRDQNFKAVRLLDALAIMTSSTISITKIIRDSNNITIEGLAQSDIEITLFMKKLAKSLIFSQPVLVGISSKNVGEIIQRFFQLKLVQQE
jgi:type IV pilus assembly protein PilN